MEKTRLLVTVMVVVATGLLLVGDGARADEDDERSEGEHHHGAPDQPPHDRVPNEIEGRRADIEGQRAEDEERAEDHECRPDPHGNLLFGTLRHASSGQYSEAVTRNSGQNGLRTT